MLRQDLDEIARKNVLTDVGGVTFTFDKNKRKEIWLNAAGELIYSVLADGKSATDIFPALTVNPYANHFGITVGFNEEFTAYAREIAEAVGIDTTSQDFAEKAGQYLLKTGMLLNPTATALLEHIQGIALETRELTAEAVPGIYELMEYIKSTGGVFKGYSTGASMMPDQFHKSIGLDALVGNVITTFPGHQAKERSPQQILQVAINLRGEVEDTEIPGLMHYANNWGYNAFIDDGDNEIEMWLEATKLIVEESSGAKGWPTTYLLKRQLPTERTGIVETTKGEVIVVNSLDQVREILSGNHKLLAYASDYQIDFTKSDQKFG